MFDRGAKDFQTYEILRSKISIALRRTLMVRKIQNQADYLEKEVSTRTKELLLSNEKLKMEIAERQRIEKVLVKSEERFRELALFLPTILVECNRKPQITFLNKAACEALGISEKEEHKRGSIINSIYSEDMDRFAEYCETIIIDKKPEISEFRIQQPNGDIINLLAKASPINHKQDEVEGIRLSAINIKPFMSSLLMPEEEFFRHYRFTPRVKEVMLLMIKGFKTKEIARKLFIAENTVKVHLFKITIGTRQDIDHTLSKKPPAKSV